MSYKQTLSGFVYRTFYLLRDYVAVNLDPVVSSSPARTVIQGQHIDGFARSYCFDKVRRGFRVLLVQTLKSLDCVGVLV